MIFNFRNLTIYNQNVFDLLIITLVRGDYLGRFYKDIHLKYFWIRSSKHKKTSAKITNHFQSSWILFSLFNCLNNWDAFLMESGGKSSVDKYSLLLSSRW